MSKQARPVPPTIRQALRGMWAVVWLVVTAGWELVTALLGIRPTFLPGLRRLGHLVAERYRAGARQWSDFEIVHDGEVEP